MKSAQEHCREAANRIVAALKEHVPGDQHDLMGDIGLVRNWAEYGAKKYDEKKEAETSE